MKFLIDFSNKHDLDYTKYSGVEILCANTDTPEDAFDYIFYIELDNALDLIQLPKVWKSKIILFPEFNIYSCYKNINISEFTGLIEIYNGYRE